MKNKCGILFIFLFFLHFELKLSSQNPCFVYQNILITGNKKTKESVILRELGLKPKDSFCDIQNQLNIWQNRLTGLSLFNSVSLQTKGDTLLIKLTERIYFWGYPELNTGDRNWNVFFKHPSIKRLTLGIYAFKKNIQGLNHSLELTAIGGYNKNIGITYKIPFNRYTKSMAYSLSAGYLYNHEVWYKTENNILQFFKIPDRAAQKNFQTNFKISKRINYFNSVHSNWLYSFNYVDSAVTGFSGNSHYFLNGNSQQNIGWTLEYLCDHRNQRDFPVSGFYLRSYVQPLYRFSENKNTWNTEFYFKANWYKPLHKKLVMATSISSRYTIGYLPYNNTRQMGYQQDYIRGYEPYVMDGNGYAIGKMILRYALLNNSILSLPKFFVPFKNYRNIPIQLWCSIFADGGQVLKPNKISGNELATQFLVGKGISLDVLFAYNAMVRLDYALSKNNQSQFNIAFINPF